jgi:hypothetical protein
VVFAILLVATTQTCPCHASITIVDSGKTLVSKPEKKVGEQLWKGYEYMGRLQFVHGNLQLCKGDRDDERSSVRSSSWSITAPPDGLPGESKDSTVQ